MKSVRRYSFLNALIRTKLSRLLDESALRSLASAADLTELPSLLRDTDYAALCPLLEEHRPLKLVETALRGIEIRHHRELLDHASGPVRGIIFSLMESYEIERLERILRIWREQAWEEMDSTMEERICYDVPVDALLKASSIEEFILLLDRTPYRKALTGGYERYRSSRKLFYLETALEADYHRRLLETVRELEGRDRRIAEDVIGLEIDILNLETVLRLMRYSDLHAGEVRELLLPGGSRLTPELLLEVYSSGRVAPIRRAFPEALRPLLASAGEKEEAFAQLRLVEALREEGIEGEARRLLRGYPFTLGTVFGYLILRRREAGRLRRIVTAKILGLREGKTAG